MVVQVEVHVPYKHSGLFLSDFSYLKKNIYIKTLPWSLASPQTETRNTCGGKLTIMPWEDRGLYEKYEKIFNQCGIYMPINNF